MNSLEPITELIESEVPDDVSIARVTYEGPELIVYTDTPRKFAENDHLIRQLANEVKKRITVRPAPGTQTDPSTAKPVILDLLPEEAGVTNLGFYPATGEVLIEAEKPGLVIGRRASTLREISQKVGWTPEVFRTPPMESSTVANVRNFLLQERDERREFLEGVGERIHRERTHETEWVRVTTLGCCREVGRASFILSTPETRILVDCGDKPGAEGEVPYLQAPEANPIAALDAVVLTHAHLDHSALLPLLFKYGYDGPVYLTQPTRDLMGLLQLDYLDVAAKEGRTPPYGSEMVREELRHTITVDYGDVTDIAPDVKLTFANAGHVLGSAVTHFHIGDGFHNVVFSGDIHYEDTRLFNGASNDFPRAETLVMESTYGGRDDYQTDQRDSEEKLFELISETHEAGGKVVIPAFAVGRSQELMLVLEEAMSEGAIPTMPVYLDGMIREATAIHTAYPHFLRDELRQRILHEDDNPFLAEQFQQVDGGHDMRERIARDGEQCVILSTSGMVTGGPIMSWLELLGGEPENALMFVGYQAQGTLGRRIQSGRREIPFESRGRRNNELTLRLSVASVSGFSGHADRAGLEEFVRTMSPRPERILCVHGDESSTDQLSSGLYQDLHVRTHAPRNLETYRFD
ncbi:mRNA 3-end processing factor-like protein [Halogeometricum pallidum JCM 14848]|uniref:Transcription termination factor FttA n=1 Tax=Halogeometricum pallidum JCM 14848 TaxID=1227487 RepID=M0DG41_HALPD|nr:beta-CASP ribonuclease aCPSF1 [Halogeometricum pallidum]ELZ34461.1 mRNA 3-end processing factor-like protein [Halogeometricum pallidum JCM 14848]